MSDTQTRQAAEPRTVGDEYEIRWCGSADAERVHTLLTDELGRGPREWFDWKYVGDPYLSHIPINFIEHDGEIIGMQGYVPAELRSGEQTVLALQPVDAFIHPSHRRNGLYTELTQQAIDRYTGDQPSLFFNYPNPGALGAQEKLGWESLGELAVYYRFQRPSAHTGSIVGGAGGRLLGVAADAVVRGGLAALDRTASRGPGLEVVRHEQPPSRTLATLYERHVPNRLHVHRGRQFYDWWLADPTHEFVTYVARDGTEPVGAIVTRKPKPQVLQLRDAVPLVPAGSDSVFKRLLATVLRDNDDVATVKSVGATLPAALLRRFGFVRDSSPVIDSFTTPVLMAARPLVEDGRGGDLPEAVTDNRNWHPTFLELDRD